MNLYDKMNNEFVPYQQARDLKELGFDEPCFYPYLKLTQRMDSTYVNFKDWNDDHPDICSAPLYRQVFRWFYEKYNIYAWVYPILDKSSEKKIWWTFNTHRPQDEYFLTRDQAEL